jgi:hypothetical protein
MEEHDEEPFDDFFRDIKDERKIDWDEESDEDEHFNITKEKKRQPTTEEYIKRYGFGVE